MINLSIILLAIGLISSYIYSKGLADKIETIRQDVLGIDESGK
jgi:hypothetical protein